MVLDNLLDLGLKLRVNQSLRDLLKKSVLGGEVLTELRLPLGDLVDGDGVEETVDTGVDDGNLDFSGKRLVLTLLCKQLVSIQFSTSRLTSRTEELSQTGTTGEEETSGGIEIGTELSEGSDFTVLGEVELERTSELLHDFPGVVL